MITIPPPIGKCPYNYLAVYANDRKVMDFPEYDNAVYFLYKKPSTYFTYKDKFMERFCPLRMGVFKSNGDFHEKSAIIIDNVTSYRVIYAFFTVYSEWHEKEARWLTDFHAIGGIMHGSGLKDLVSDANEEYQKHGITLYV